VVPVWPEIRLEQLLEPATRPRAVKPMSEYRLLGIRLDGAGPFVREVTSGSAIAATTLHEVKAGDFVYSRLFAWRGAFGVVAEGLDGAFVSGEFPAFTTVADRLDARFLELRFRLAGTLGQVAAPCTGSTPLTRTRFKEERLREMVIPLPPVPEQRRIVAKLDAIAAKTEQARRLRIEVLAQVEALLPAEEMQIWPASSIEGAPTLQDVTTFLARGRQAEQGDSDHYLIKTQHVQLGRYVQTSITLAPHAAGKVSPDALARDGDLLIACSAAGCLGRVARYKGDGVVASTDTHVAIARPNPEVIQPEYLYHYLKGAQGQYQLRSRERGDWMRDKIGFRLTELNLSDLRNVPVPLPSCAEQHRIVAYLDGLQAKVDELKQRQAQTAAALNALMPAVLDKAFRGEL